MDPTVVVARYFDAWNSRDPEAIGAVFAEEGRYRIRGYRTGSTRRGPPRTPRACSRPSPTSPSTWRTSRTAATASSGRAGR